MMKKLFVVMTLVFGLMGGSAFALEIVIRGEAAKEIVLDGEVIASNPEDVFRSYMLLIRFNQNIYFCTVRYPENYDMIGYECVTTKLM